jgi:uncharacterized protein (TIGR02246 family)
LGASSDADECALDARFGRPPASFWRMIRHMLRLCAFAMAAVALGGCAAQRPTADAAGDKASIESALRRWPKDFNAKNADGVCGLFADDVTLAYPGGEDRGRGEFCRRMQTLFDDPAKRYRYEQPDIREVLVDGDLATVKLFWTLTVTDAAGKVLDTGVEDGLDVFVRQPDGRWKIHVSHAFTK